MLTTFTETIISVQSASKNYIFEDADFNFNSCLLLRMTSYLSKDSSDMYSMNYSKTCQMCFQWI